MERIVNVVVLVVLAVMLFFVIAVAAISGSSDDPRDIAEAEFALPWIGRAIGIFLSSVATLVLLLKALGGSRLEEALPFIIVILGASLLGEIHWASAIALGALAVAAALREAVQLVLAQKRDRDGNAS